MAGLYLWVIISSGLFALGIVLTLAKKEILAGVCYLIACGVGVKAALLGPQLISICFAAFYILIGVRVLIRTVVLLRTSRK